MRDTSVRLPFITLLPLLATCLARDIVAQTQLDIPFIKPSQTLSTPSTPVAGLLLKRTCKFALSVTGAARADVKDWRFHLGDIVMNPLGPAGDDQPASYLARVPKSAPDTLPLTLSGAPAAAIASLGPIALRVVDLGDREQCQSETGVAAKLATVPRQPRGYPPIYDRARRMANLRFNSFGLPDTTARGSAEKFPAGITDNDAITVLLDLPDSVPVSEYSVQVSGNIKGEEINIVGQGDLSKLPGIGLPFGAEAAAPGSAVFSMGTFGPYSAPQVTVRIVRTDAGKSVVDRSYTLRIRRTYLAALRLGVGRSGVRFSDFEVEPRSATDTTHVIRDLSQSEGREVRPYLTLVFYGWRFWEKGFWDGRDIEAEPTVAERLNPMVGAGLKKPGDEWLLGFSLEVARGLDVSLAYQAARVSVLPPGFQVDSVFTGAVPPPTSKQWKSGVVIGASLDLRVAVSVLTGLLASGK